VPLPFRRLFEMRPLLQSHRLLLLLLLLAGYWLLLLPPLMHLPARVRADCSGLLTCCDTLQKCTGVVEPYCKPVAGSCPFTVVAISGPCAAGCPNDCCQCSAPSAPTGTTAGNCSAVMAGNGATCLLQLSQGYYLAAGSLNIQCNNGSLTPLPTILPSPYWTLKLTGGGVAYQLMTSLTAPLLTTVHLNYSLPSSVLISNATLTAFMAGDNCHTTPDSDGVYGTFQVPADTVVPRSRYDFVSWSGQDGHLFIFGGLGNDDVHSDIMRYSRSTRQWYVRSFF
jgi:hypothetical protein